LPTGEVLSQSEIDALLSALSAGEVSAEEIKKEEEEKKVKIYDFKRALRFSKEQIRSLSRIHENFARLLTTYFSGKLRIYVQINVASVDQIPYEEFVRSIPNMTFLYLYEIPPLSGNILIEVNPNVAYAMLDRVLGGLGKSENKIEQLTDIEQKIMTKLFTGAFDQMRESWGSIAEIEPQMKGFEVNPQFLQMVSPNETVVVISLTVTIGETSGMINICIPHLTLEPVIPRLSMHFWMQTEKKNKNPENVSALSNRVKNAPVLCTVELGNSTITVEELMGLDTGDCIILNKKIDEPVVVKIGGVPKYLAQPGKLKNKMAVQILEEIKEEKNEHE
jgi:flagellar motor switch protein FliM